ncbi:MAG: hypothetical protein QOI31_769, partial [Solirubrobacterales bacterium]|nr:hypothetical protein [Solirubrobacterales bacterium]
MALTGARYAISAAWSPEAASRTAIHVLTAAR